MWRLNFLFLLLFVVACVPGGKTELVFKDGQSSSGPSDGVSGNDLDYALEAQVADRAYVESTLLQVFDATNTSDATVIQNNVYLKKEFGGPCDRYAASFLANGNAEFPRESCTNGIEIDTTSNSNPSRYSYTMKTCDSLTKSTRAMTVIYQKIMGRTSAMAPTDDHIKKLYQLFYPQAVASDEIVTAFQDLYKKGSSATDGWQMMTFTICSSPDWQIL